MPILSTQGQTADAWNVEGLDGWTLLDPLGETYAYVSATSFTITSNRSPQVDYSPYFKKGCRVKLTNSTLKYFVCSADATYAAGVTTITVTGGSDYSLANATISGVNLSFGDPPDYPDWFNYSPTITGYSVNPTSTTYRFKVSGKSCVVTFREVTAGTSNATTTTYSAPITAKTVGQANWQGAAVVIDNGSVQSAPGLLEIGSAGTVFNVFKAYNEAAWTASGGKRIHAGAIEYEI